MIEFRHRQGSIFQAIERREAEGAMVTRLFPVRGLRNLDPFVLWDEFRVSPGNGFPEHPHRGFQAITILFSGNLEHRDNLGNQVEIFPDEIQLFTAGRGITHAEMAMGNEPAHGIQLWINLPKKLKEIEPGYLHFSKDQFPVRKSASGWERTLIGNETTMSVHTSVHLMEVYLAANHTSSYNVPFGHTGFSYVQQGEVSINRKTVREKQAIIINDDNKLIIKAHQDCHFFLCLGLPHNEPIHQHGTFVD